MAQPPSSPEARKAKLAAALKRNMARRKQAATKTKSRAAKGPKPLKAGA